MTSSPPSSDDGPGRLTTDELRQRLDQIFYFDVSSGRNYDDLIDVLTLLPRPKQDFALHWAAVAAQTHLEIGYLVILMTPEALRRLSFKQAEQWVIAALDAYDGSGVRPAVARLRDIEGFARGPGGQALSLESIEGRLARFLQGLSGRPLHLAAAKDGVAWTDTETVFLPPSLDAGSADAALERYKALAALHWAQGRYGTFQAEFDAVLSTYPQRELALDWLGLLEALRLTACVGRELPGLRASMDDLVASLPPQLDAARADLARPDATVHDSLAWLPRLIASPPPRLP